jgi:sulfite reductase (NADPH) hemoprotein beta-component
VAAHFAPPAYESLPAIDPALVESRADSRAFSRWVERNVHDHRVPGYAA